MRYLPWVLAPEHGDAPAVRDDDVDLSYAELDNWVAAVATQFTDRGVKAGDIVAVMLPNQVELVVAMGAAWRIGAAVTPINPAFTASEARHQIVDARARLLVNATGEEVVEDVLTLAAADLARNPVGEVPEPAELTPEDLALVIYTSGSTGAPKGVMLTHSNTELMTSAISSTLELTAEDHCLLILPLFHVNAIMVSLFATLRVGGQLSIVGTFSASTFFDRVETLRPTFFSAVPTIYALLVTQAEKRKPDMSSLRFAVCGAAPATKELLQAFEEKLGTVILEGYGLTEATCATSINPLDGPRKVGTVGKSLPGQEVRIVNGDMEEVPQGEAGEVVIKGGVVMAGYLGKPEVTAQTIVDGWLRTGDVGFLDEDGYLTLVDRLKDMIIRGGENLYPKEIETAIGSYPGVLEVAVVGEPDTILGEVPVAFVVPYPGTTITGEQIRQHCAELLTKVKVPTAVNIVDSLPKNPVGKIDKPTLRRGLHTA